jgi:hypothetical protein
LTPALHKHKEGTRHVTPISRSSKVRGDLADGDFANNGHRRAMQSGRIRSERAGRTSRFTETVHNLLPEESDE